MSKPIIFLDLDGVLNHEGHFRSEYSMSTEWHIRYFDPESVSILNNITDETGARIVFSSSHRMSFDRLEDLQAALKLAGITGQVIGKTPRLWFAGRNKSVPRGCEIQAWMEDNKNLLGASISKLKYAILDDDNDMLYWHRDSFFQTTREYGLTEGIGRSIIKHFTK